jgi:hypothetical protein
VEETQTISAKSSLHLAATAPVECVNIMIAPVLFISLKPQLPGPHFHRIVRGTGRCNPLNPHSTGEPWCSKLRSLPASSTKPHMLPFLLHWLQKSIGMGGHAPAMGTSKIGSRIPKRSMKVSTHVRGEGTFCRPWGRTSEQRSCSQCEPEKK